MKKTIKSYLPVFPGFYNTIFECYVDEDNYDSEAEHYGYKPGEVPEDAFRVRYDDYREDVSRKVTGILSDRLCAAIPGLEKIEFENLYSPREYNFKNDSIDVAYYFSDYEAFRRFWIGFVTENTAVWKQHLEKNCKSRSGFTSFYPHTPFEWAEDTDNFKDLSDPVRLGLMLECLCSTLDDCACEYLWGECEIHGSSYIDFRLPAKKDLPGSVREKLDGLDRWLSLAGKLHSLYQKVRPKYARRAEQHLASAFKRAEKEKRDILELCIED